MQAGDKIKKIRISKKMTQKELAEKLDWSYVVINQYENKKRFPKLETIKKIAAALEVPYTDLLDDIDMADVEKSFLSYADEIAKKRGIYDIDKRLQKLGFSISLTLDEEVHESTINIDGIKVPISDDELKALEKDSDDYLKFKLIELRNKKAHK